MALIVLIRHCASSGQAPNAELSSSGEAAAEELVGRLAALAPDAVYSSPYRRAVATVTPFAKRAGLPIVLDARLKERVLADRPLEDWMEHIRRSFEDRDHAGPGGESFTVVLSRALAALSDIVEADHRLPIVASHGNLISTVLRSVDTSFAFEDWRRLQNPDLFELSFSLKGLQSWRRLK